MQLYHHVYVSRASGPLSEDEVAQIVRKAAENNAQVGITGLLLYGSGYFMQLLEGPRPLIEAVMDTIEHDPRHTDIETVVLSPTPRRVFPSWSMGLINLDVCTGQDLVNQVKHIREFLAVLPAGSTTEHSLAALKLFRKYASDAAANQAADVA